MRASYRQNEILQFPKINRVEDASYQKLFRSNYFLKMIFSNRKIITLSHLGVVRQPFHSVIEFEIFSLLFSGKAQPAAFFNLAAVS